MLARIDRVENLLVELCRKETSETVKLSFRLLHSENFTIVAPQILVFTLRKDLKLFLVGVWQMSEREYIL